jgi:hypothetical protein
MTVPLDLDATGHNLPELSAADDSKHLTYSVIVEWDGRGIGEIARAHGIDHVEYADLETLSVLGVWTQRHVHIYGTKATP